MEVSDCFGKFVITFVLVKLVPQTSNFVSESGIIVDNDNRGAHAHLFVFVSANPAFTFVINRSFLF